jgi:glycerophosphoryl diester phosphodiesterase
MNRMQMVPPSFETIYRDFLDCNGRVMITAHRGNWRKAPENSLQAILFSIDSGVDIVEIDVQKTKDGCLVLMHDETVDRMTNGSGTIADLTFEEIRSLRLKQGQGGDNSPVTNVFIPTVEEVMTLAKNKVMINLDKCWGIREDVYQVLVKTGTVRQGLFKSPAETDEIGEFLNSKIERPEFMQLINESNQHLLGQLDQIFSKIKPAAFELNFQQDDSHIISAETLQLLKGKCRIWVNTMFDSDCGGHTDEVSLTNPQLGWEWHLERGANLIQTDNPEQLYNYLNKTTK